MISKRSIVNLLIATPVVYLVIVSVLILNDKSVLRIKSFENENKQSIGEPAKIVNIIEVSTTSKPPIETSTSLQEESTTTLKPVNQAPGELNVPVNIDADKLNATEKIKFDEGWKKNSFNQYASDTISVSFKFISFKSLLFQ